MFANLENLFINIGLRQIYLLIRELYSFRLVKEWRE